MVQSGHSNMIHKICDHKMKSERVFAEAIHTNHKVNFLWLDYKNSHQYQACFVGFFGFKYFFQSWKTVNNSSWCFFYIVYSRSVTQKSSNFELLNCTYPCSCLFTGNTISQQSIYILQVAICINYSYLNITWYFLAWSEFTLSKLWAYRSNNFRKRSLQSAEKCVS